MVSVVALHSIALFTHDSSSAYRCRGHGGHVLAALSVPHSPLTIEHLARIEKSAHPPPFQVVYPE